MKFKSFLDLIELMENFIHVDCLNCVVSGCPIALYLDDDWKKKINHSKIVAAYRKEQVLVKQNTKGAGIFIVHSGRILIIAEREKFARHIIRIAKPGDIIEHKTTDEEISNPFTAAAFEKAVICFIPKAIFFQLLKENSVFTFHLERFYTAKFIKAEERLKNSLIMNTQAKVADALLMLSDSFEGNVPFSRKELSEFIGISVDHTSRELKKLLKQSIIGKDPNSKENKIVIKDVTKLLSIVKKFDENYTVK